MIVNENLYSGNDIYVPPNNIKYQFIPVDFGIDFEVGKSYTISCEVSVSEGESCELRIYNENYREVLFSKRFIVDSREFMTFKFDDSNKYRAAFYAGIAGKTINIKAYYKKIKIEPGDQMTPYIPNKNSVKADNQAVFLSGGVFQEVYPR